MDKTKISVSLSRYQEKPDKSQRNDESVNINYASYSVFVRVEKKVIYLKEKK